MRIRFSLGDTFKGLPREVAVLVAVAVAVAIGFGVVAPVIPAFARSFGVGKTAAGAVIAAFGLMRFVSALGGGRLVDAFGERIILASGIGIVAVSTGLAGLSQNYAQLLILRGVGGIGSAMFTVSATALLLRVVDASRRGRATGLFQSGFLIGGLLGPLVGGYLGGISLRVPFYVYAVSLVAAGSIAYVFLQQAAHRVPEEDGSAPAPAADAAEETELAEPEAAEVLGTGAVQTVEPVDAPASTTLAEAWAHPAFRAAVAVNFSVGWALFGLRFSLVPLYVVEAMDQNVRWVGVGFLCSSLAQVGFLVVAGTFVDKTGRRPAMIIGTLLGAVSLAMMAVTTALPVFLVAMAVGGVSGAFVGTAPGAVVGDIMHGRGGRVVAVFQMASDAGSIGGPLIAGALADLISFEAAFAASAAVLVIAAAMSLRMPETLPKAT